LSEYQYHEFAAVDWPLKSRELDALRGLSTRAHNTPTSFVNTYEWGNLRGDPRVMVERYFEQVRREHGRKPSFVERLTRAGL